MVIFKTQVLLCSSFDGHDEYFPKIRSEVRREKTTIIFSLQNMFRVLLDPSSVAIILNC